jgi:uncharacterized protein
MRMRFSIHTGGERVLYIIYQEDRDDGAEIRAANKDEHFAYLDRHQDILLLGGALLGDDGVKRTGSCLIINVPSREQAEEFSRNEPFRKAGLFKSVKIARMRRGQWNPAAAPKRQRGTKPCWHSPRSRYSCFTEDAACIYRRPFADVRFRG